MKGHYEKKRRTAKGANSHPKDFLIRKSTCKIVNISAIFIKENISSDITKKSGKKGYVCFIIVFVVEQYVLKKTVGQEFRRRSSSLIDKVSSFLACPRRLWMLEIA